MFHVGFNLCVVYCVGKGVDVCDVVCVVECCCLICDARSWRYYFMGNMCVSSCIYCVFVSVLFCVIFSLLMSVSAANYNHMVETYSSISLVMAFYVVSIVSFCLFMSMCVFPEGMIECLFLLCICLVWCREFYWCMWCWRVRWVYVKYSLSPCIIRILFYMTNLRETLSLSCL